LNEFRLGPPAMSKMRMGLLIIGNLFDVVIPHWFMPFFYCGSCAPSSNCWMRTHRSFARRLLFEVPYPNTVARSARGTMLPCISPKTADRSCRSRVCAVSQNVRTRDGTACLSQQNGEPKLLRSVLVPVVRDRYIGPFPNRIPCNLARRRPAYLLNPIQLLLNGEGMSS